MAKATLTLSEMLDSTKPARSVNASNAGQCRPSYFGAEMVTHYFSAGVGQSRDSDCLEQCNFA